MCKRSVYSKAELPELQSGLAAKALLVMWFESSAKTKEICAAPHLPGFGVFSLPFGYVAVLLTVLTLTQIKAKWAINGMRKKV